MNIWLVIAVSIVIIVAVVFALWLIASIVVFVWQELNHSFKNFKRAVKHGLWDLEWKFRKRG